jgi:tryptophan synthase alpha subunit
MAKKKAVSPMIDPVSGALAALRRAAKRALELGIAMNTPVWVMERGKIVDIAKRERRKRKFTSKKLLAMCRAIATGKSKR